MQFLPVVPVSGTDNPEQWQHHLTCTSIQIHPVGALDGISSSTLQQQALLSFNCLVESLGPGAHRSACHRPGSVLLAAALPIPVCAARSWSCTSEQQTSGLLLQGDASRPTFQ